jgi:Nicotianamine synthase protein/Acetyltransferase (GNAT) domain
MSVAVRAFAPENAEEPLVLLRQVCDVHKAVVESRLDFSRLHEHIMQLESFVFSFTGGEDQATGFLEGLTPALVSGLNDAYCFWETDLEQRFALKLLKGGALLSDYLLYGRFDELVRRELSLASDIWPERILFIGSGALPISAIHIHLQTGLPVDCVAPDREAAAIAGQVLQKCKLDNSVRVFFEGDGGYDVSAYGLIFLGALARSKTNSLRRLRKKCRMGCHILCRTTHGLRRLLYEAATDRAVRGFHTRGARPAEGAQTASTLLLETAGSAATDVRLEWLRGIDPRLASEILRLMNRTLEEETTIGFPGPIEEETGRGLMRQLHADVETGRRHVLVAEKGGLIVGQLILTPNSVPNHHHMVELTRGTIDRSFRGGGLALRAFEEVVRKCEELGREVICLDVRAGTMAAMWWQHFGFKPFGLLEDYSRVRDKRYQGLFLTQTAADLKCRVKELAGKTFAPPNAAKRPRTRTKPLLQASAP